jgi:hypothetical protein
VFKKLLYFMSVCLLLVTAKAFAQGGSTPPAITGSGATATIPVFLTPTTIGASNISTSGSTVSVTGEVVSIGPGAGFRVLGGAGDDVNGSPWYGVGQSTLNLFPGQQNAVQVAGFYGLDFETSQGTMVIRGDSGYIGLNTDSPGEMLEVNGNIKLTSGTGAHVEYPDGTIQTTAYVGTSCPISDLVMPNHTIVAQGGDYAESIDIVGERSTYEPGDVLVIDPEHPEHFLKSAKPYSTLVAGIYSTKPGYVGRRQRTDIGVGLVAEVPMAMVGIVPTKVSTENGPIRVGDLLVTSSKFGYAMRGTKKSAMAGAVVGKALGALSSGSGVISALVSLQ